MKKGKATIFHLASLHLHTASFDIYTLEDLNRFSMQLRDLEWIEDGIDLKRVLYAIGKARPVFHYPDNALLASN